MTLYTIGHGTRSTEELVEALRYFGVRRLVDVRTYPGSRTNPQFGREQLEKGLPAYGITYEHCAQLGGRRRGLGPDSPNRRWKNTAFRGYADHMLQDGFWAALDDLLREAAAVPTAVMCAETLWWRCHRRLIADAATARGAAVVHIMTSGVAQPHKMLPPASLVGDRVTYVAEGAGDGRT